MRHGFTPVAKAQSQSSNESGNYNKLTLGKSISRTEGDEFFIFIFRFHYRTTWGTEPYVALYFV